MEGSQMDADWLCEASGVAANGGEVGCSAARKFTDKNITAMKTAAMKYRGGIAVRPVAIISLTLSSKRGGQEGRLQRYKSLGSLSGTARFAIPSRIWPSNSEGCIDGAGEHCRYTPFDALGAQAFCLEIAFHSDDAVGILLALSSQANGDAIDERGAAPTARVGGGLMCDAVHSDRIIGVDRNDGQASRRTFSRSTAA